MAQQRNDIRYNTAPARSTQNSKKTTEKWETLKGWQATAQNDDTGIESWAKRRRQVDERAAKSHRGYVQVCDPFMCSFTPLCTEIEDVTSFKQESLSHILNPHVKHSKDLNNDGKFAKGTATKRDIDKDVENGNKDIDTTNTYEQGNEQTENTNSDSSHPVVTKLTKNTTKHNSEHSVKGGKANGAAIEKTTSGSSATRDRDVTSAAARANRLISIVRANSSKQLSNADNSKPATSLHEGEWSCNPTDNDAITHQGSGETANLTDPESTPSDTNIRSTKHNHPGTPARTELTPRAIKLSYTQSNIALRNPYTALTEMGFEEMTPAMNHGPRCVTFTFGITDTGETNGDTSGQYVRSQQGMKENIRATPLFAASPIIQNGSAYTKQISQNGTRTTSRCSEYTPTNPREVLVDGFTTTTLKGTKSLNGDISDRTKSAVSQKQISLVLKKVSIQDNGNEELDAKSTSSLNAALPPKPTTRRHVNGLSKNSDLSFSHNMVPFGELLPAVDNGIKSCRASRSSRATPQHESEEEIFCLDKDGLVSGRDRQLPYEDNIFTMREGTEQLIMLRERQHTVLGPPGFKPPSNKTPLQRAKETTNKRIYGQLNQPGHISYTDVNKLKWPSSCGTLYPGNRGTTSPDGETKSAPVTGSTDTAEWQRSGSKNLFSGFTTAESCPDSLSAALIKAGIEPISNIYQLSKRRKQPKSTARPLGGQAAYHTDNSIQYSDNIRIKTTPSVASPGSTQVDLAHIRDKNTPPR